ncbi:hypothetical protein D3C73_884830 [compost metagenome]
MLMKETRPFAFFGAISSVFMAMSLIFMTPVLISYFETGLVERMPTWVFSLVLMVLSSLMFTAGLILDSVSRARAEQLRIHYMSLPLQSRTNSTPINETFVETSAQRGGKSAA